MRKKSEIILITLKNLLAAAVVIFLVAILVFLIQGWVIDSNGKTIQTGLVQFGANVSGSTVEIGQKTLSEKTNTKSQVIPGEHEFKIWREGYETWYRKTSVAAEQVLWLNYARLVPKEKKLDSFFDIQNLRSAKFSKDKDKALMVGEKEGLMKLWLVKLGELQKIQEIPLSADIFAREIGEGADVFADISKNISIEELNQDATRAVLKWENGDRAEWIYVDISSPEKSFNMTDNFGFEFSRISPIDRNFDKIYSLNGEELREIDTSEKTISAKKIDRVVDFSAYGEELLTLVRKNKTSGFDTEIYRIKDSKSDVVMSGNSVQPKFRISEYFNEKYAYILSGKKITIFKGSEWRGEKKPKKFKEFEVDFETLIFEVNREGRILQASGENRSATYDLETLSRYNIKSGRLNWLDNFILYNFEKGKFTIRDFDGSNRQEIFGVLPEFPIVLSRDEKYIYGFTVKADGNWQLTRVKMIL